MFVTERVRVQQEDQLAITDVSEKRDPNGRVQDDWVTAAATPRCVPTTEQIHLGHAIESELQLE